MLFIYIYRVNSYYMVKLVLKKVWSIVEKRDGRFSIVKNYKGFINIIY